MSYKNKYGITNITSWTSKKYSKRFGVLDISWDFTKDPNKKHQKYPVFLYTPDMQNTKNHYHIPLSRSQAKKLRNWLNDYLRNTCKKY